MVYLGPLVLNLSLGSCGSKTQLRRICFVAHSHDSWQDCFSQAVGWRPPSYPCHVGLSIEHLTLWQLAPSELGDERAREGELVHRGQNLL